MITQVLRRAALVTVACAFVPLLLVFACVIGPERAWSDYERAVRAAWGDRRRNLRGEGDG